MSDTAKRFTWAAIFATAMACLEAVVVVYIRALLDITVDHVSLGPYARLEMAREAATLVMLAAVGCLAGRRSAERLAYGLFAFGWWDMGYYVWLKVFIGWPASLLSWDTLFLLPVPWWGPVLAPVLIAALICTMAVFGVTRLERGAPHGWTRARLAQATLGALLALYTFMAGPLGALIQGRSDWNTLRPVTFAWPLFLLGLGLMAWPSLRATWPLSHTRLRRLPDETA